MDEVDARILSVLQQDSRLSYREVARRVHLSPPAVADRVRRLESAGVITGYTCAVDAAKLGYALRAFVQLATSGSDACRRFSATVPSMPEVVECHRVTGRNSYVLQVVARSTEDLERVVNRLMEFGEPTTSIVLSAPLERRPLTPAGHAGRDGAIAFAQRAAPGRSRA